MAVAFGVLLGAETDRAGAPRPRPVVERPARQRDRPWRPVSVAPRVGSPDTLFRLRAPTSPPSRTAPQDYAGFELTGPGGRACHGRLRSRFGVPFRVRYLLPQREDPLRRPHSKPWCPGRYRITAVELRSNARPLRVLARLAFEVRGRAGPAPRVSQGVTHGRIGEDIVGGRLTYRQLVARLGEPRTVPPGHRCVYYDAPAARAVFSWRFCFRHGGVHSAGGSPGIPLHGRWPR